MAATPLDRIRTMITDLERGARTLGTDIRKRAGSVAAADELEAALRQVLLGLTNIAAQLEKAAGELRRFLAASAKAAPRARASKKAGAKAAKQPAKQAAKKPAKKAAAKTTAKAPAKANPRSPDRHLHPGPVRPRASPAGNAPRPPVPLPVAAQRPSPVRLSPNGRIDCVKPRNSSMHPRCATRWPMPGMKRGASVSSTPADARNPTGPR